MKTIRLLVALAALAFAPTALAQKYKNPDAKDKDQQQTDESASEESQQAQEKPKKERSGFDPDRLFFGGGLGLQTGSGLSIVEVTPTIGYIFGQEARWEAALRGTYIHVSDSRFANDYTYNVYGAALVGRYWAFQDVRRLGDLGFQAEYEGLNFEFRDEDEDFTARRWYPSALAGMAWRQSAGAFSVNVTFLYNLDWSPSRSYYPSPLVYRGSILFNPGW